MLGKRVVQEKKGFSPRCEVWIAECSMFRKDGCRIRGAAGTAWVSRKPSFVFIVWNWLLASAALVLHCFDRNLIKVGVSCSEGPVCPTWEHSPGQSGKYWPRVGTQLPCQCQRCGVCEQETQKSSLEGMEVITRDVMYLESVLYQWLRTRWSQKETSKVLCILNTMYGYWALTLCLWCWVIIYFYANWTLSAAELKFSCPVLLCKCEQTTPERLGRSVVFGGCLTLVLHVWKAGSDLVYLTETTGLIKMSLFCLWKEIISSRQFSVLDDSEHSVQMM